MSGPVVTTDAGAIRGTMTHEEVVAFRGIPYAAPPTGPLRFRPPEPVAHWDGVRAAIAAPAACPQPRLPRLFDKLDPAVARFRERYDEDCLTVNVWTPAADDGRRPVLVWFHGGWFSVGSGNEPTFDGATLARRGDVVVVTVNHRLGMLGFLALDEVGGEEFATSGNAGTLDMVAALRWVRTNIARFGGDPGNVTIFGESGGACKVSVLLAAPAAEGLFHRAILQSGPLLRVNDASRARATTKAVLDELAVSTVEELQGLPVDSLVAAQDKVLGGPLGGLYGDGPRLAPVLDGVVLDAHPFDPVAAPTASRVPIMVGSCKDESTMLVAVVPGIDDMEPVEQVRLLTDNVYGHDLDDLWPRYGETRPQETVMRHFLAASSDQVRVGGIQVAERQLAAGAPPVYMYRLDYEPPVYGGKLGAVHTLDIGFVFDNTDRGAGATSPNRGLYQGGPEVQRLTAEMSEAWIAFARSGDPNHGQLPHWPPYDTTRRATMIFDRKTQVADDPDGSERLLWAGRLGGM